MSKRYYFNYIDNKFGVIERGKCSEVLWYASRNTRTEVLLAAYKSHKKLAENGFESYRDNHIEQMLKYEKLLENIDEIPVIDYLEQRTMELTDSDKCLFCENKLSQEQRYFDTLECKTFWHAGYAREELFGDREPA